jgi:hypothetical protein
MSTMKRILAALLLAALALAQVSANAQSRLYNQAELDALLAPVALYPDPVLSNVLVAATNPDDLREASAWSRANPQLSGQDAVRAVEPMLWHPSVKALVAFPDLIARMDESPQWTADLASAFIEQEPYVMDTVQALRRRAQASGALQSDAQQQVVQQGPTIAVYPAQPQVVYVPYYDPYVVYGAWWWPAYRPVYWRPWHPRPAVFVSTAFFATRVDWSRRHVNRVVVAPRPGFVQNQVVTIHNHAQQAQIARPIVQSARLPRPVREPVRHEAPRTTSVFNHVDQARFARPIVQGAPVRAQMEPRQTHAPRQMRSGGGERHGHRGGGGRG